MKKDLIAQQDPKSPISEIFRTLRTNIQFMSTQQRLKTILVTSTFQGEGKSWVSSNLAVTFAQAGKRVVLIDADMRRGRQYSIFDVSPRPGLSNYLSGIDVNEGEGSEDLADYIQETNVENLYLIAAGNIPPNPSELLISPQMNKLLSELKSICDIVIIDGTPSELVTDSLIITRLVDATVIVTASNETKKENLKRVINNIQNVGGKIAGIVINKIPISAKKYEQAYYYGSSNSKTMNRIKPVRSRPARTKMDTMNSISRDKISRPTKIEPMKKKEEDLELPKAILNSTGIKQPETDVKTTENVTVEKTEDILKQINQYLDEEKKKLK